MEHDFILRVPGKQMCPLHEQPVMIELTVKGTVFISDPKDLGIMVLAAKMQTDNFIRQSM